jgi:hypothetical protein
MCASRGAKKAKQTQIKKSAAPFFAVAAADFHRMT